VSDAAAKAKGDMSFEFSVTDPSGRVVFEQDVEVPFAILGLGTKAIRAQRLNIFLSRVWAAYIAATVKAAVASASKKA
jgi:hypothetical protein